MNYATYDKATRRIVKTGLCAQSDVALQAKAGQTVIRCGQDVGDATHYINLAGLPVLKRPLSATWDKTEINANGEESVLSGLPIPCIVYVDSTPVTVDDGSLEFSSVTPGVYVITVDEVAYNREKWEITVD